MQLKSMVVRPNPARPNGAGFANFAISLGSVAIMCGLVAITAPPSILTSQIRPCTVCEYLAIAKTLRLGIASRWHCTPAVEDCYTTSPETYLIPSDSLRPTKETATPTPTRREQFVPS